MTDVHSGYKRLIRNHIRKGLPVLFPVFINSIDNYFGISQCQSECQKAGSEIIVVVWSGYAFQCMKEVCYFLSLSILKSRNDM